LFFAGDFQNIRIVTSPPPAAIKERGAYVALSDDEGVNWRIKKLDMAPPHVGWTGVVPKTGKPQHGFGTLGYCDAVQTPDGLIHLMTSKGKPSLHFAMNEAWILSDEAGETKAPSAVADKKSLRAQESWPSGVARFAWSYHLDWRGMVVLDGTETWNYPDGVKQYEVRWADGRDMGLESYFRQDGTKQWVKNHQPDGSMVWTTYWPSGAKKTESRWQGAWAQGVTTTYAADGSVLSEIAFKDGRDLADSARKLGDN
jgi:hypothetical protein